MFHKVHLELEAYKVFLINNPWLQGNRMMGIKKRQR